MRTEDIGMPGISGKLDGTKKLQSYVVKYYKANLDEPVDMLELSNIETKAIRAKPGDEEVVLMDKTNFSFMDKYFVIIKYLEKI
jgi:hypothetical protein